MRIERTLPIVKVEAEQHFDVVTAEAPSMHSMSGPNQSIREVTFTSNHGVFNTAMSVRLTVETNE